LAIAVAVATQEGSKTAIPIFNQKFVCLIRITDIFLFTPFKIPSGNSKQFFPLLIRRQMPSWRAGPTGRLPGIEPAGLLAEFRQFQVAPGVGSSIISIIKVAAHPGLPADDYY